MVVLGVAEDWGSFELIVRAVQTTMASGVMTSCSVGMG